MEPTTEDKKKAAKRAYNKRYHSENFEYLKDYKKVYYNENETSIKLYQENYRSKNKEKLAEKAKEYRRKNAQRIKDKKRSEYLKKQEILKEKQNTYRKNNRDIILEKSRKKYSENPEENLSKQKEYRLKNIEVCKQREKDYRDMRYKTDPVYKTIRLLRNRLTNVLNNVGRKKSKHTIELLGCSEEFFVEYIESLFRDGMNWDNHTFYGWHLDHIRPCASFDQSDPEQHKKCWHYTNFQPLWWYENLKKGDKIILDNIIK